MSGCQPAAENVPPLSTSIEILIRSGADLGEYSYHMPLHAVQTCRKKPNLHARRKRQIHMDSKETEFDSEWRPYAKPRPVRTEHKNSPMRECVLQLVSVPEHMYRNIKPLIASADVPVDRSAIGAQESQSRAVESTGTSPATSQGE